MKLECWNHHICKNTTNVEEYEFGDPIFCDACIEDSHQRDKLQK